ncbi:uncharacterized protein LOC114524515 [Dendronephthya gigantea]|uniref:uncharacterized protein LOC114524515 n=1 Tax=Dendronephthya gigantea TaxID=151771 RepID=UPI00106A0DC1|nr:uncharacterized protein LOC114524515 [Dendronephthya gigantea]
MSRIQFFQCFMLLTLLADVAYLKDCTQAIGISDGEIPDDDIIASSSYDDLSRASRGRLNIKYQPPLKSGWCSKFDNKSQYLQIDLEVDSDLTGIATQGRGREPYRHWVTKYYVSLREDGGPWFNFTRSKKVQPVIFNGNTDAFSTVFHSFDRTIKARYVRIHPVEWNVQICMRVELYGCLGKKLVIEDDDLLILFIILLAVFCFFFILLLMLLLTMRRLLKLLERRAKEKSRAEISLRDSIDGDRLFKLDRSTDDTYIPEEPTQGTFIKNSKSSTTNGNKKNKLPVYAAVHKSKEKSHQVDSYGYAHPEVKEKKIKKHSDSTDQKIILVDADEEDEKRRNEEKKSKKEEMEMIDL